VIPTIVVEVEEEVVTLVEVEVELDELVEVDEVVTVVEDVEVLVEELVELDVEVEEVVVGAAMVAFEMQVLVPKAVRPPTVMRFVVPHTRASTVEVEVEVDVDVEVVVWAPARPGRASRTRTASQSGRRVDMRPPVVGVIGGAL
jgi:hypothetical protein